MKAATEQSLSKLTGASGPTGIPEPTASATETNVAKNVFILKMCLIDVPFKNPINSGIPEPAALGLK